jgi:N-acetylmuramoyl-L-alanine amidase
MLSTFLSSGLLLAMAFLCGSAKLGAQAVPANSSPITGTVIPAIMDSAALSKLSALGQEPDWKKLEVYAGTMSKAEFEAAWHDIYSEAKAMPPPFQIRDTAISIPTGQAKEPTFSLPFSVSGEKPKSHPKMSWRRARDLPVLGKRPPLSDLVIAIDPGHIGGTYATMEERMLSFNAGESIREGDLSLMTAQILKERLMALGAVATLVRETQEPVTKKRPADFQQTALAVLKDAGFPAPSPTYAGLTGDAKLLTVQWQSEKLFYRVSEIHARAERVNQQIKPDVVLCLHFNAEAWGDATMPQFSPKNHLHILVNGCYAPVELQQQDLRFEMLQSLLSRTHEEEIPLASAIATTMSQTTGLPAYVYTTTNARRAGDSPYVYARNLLANRLYECPVVYLEPFVMNHEETYQRLLRGHYLGRTLIGEKLTTSAIEDYINGIVKGLLAYYQTHRPS